MISVFKRLIRDHFHLGLVLDKKFKRLRIAFRVFMIGFIISVIAFLLADYAGSILKPDERKSIFYSTFVLPQQE
jgi:hypothetical protein